MMSPYLRRSELKVGTLVVLSSGVYCRVGDEQAIGLIVSWDGFAGFVEVLCLDGKTRMYNDAYVQRAK